MSLIPFNVVLFDDFETLDAFGPVEIIGKMPKTYKLGYFSANGGSVTSGEQLSVNTLPFSDMDMSGVLLIPGGVGTRKLVDDADFIEQLKTLAQNASYVLTVCTGSALLAKTGLLDGKNATSNKFAFDWVCGNGENVKWIKQARWVNDEKIYTSSGVSAGIDMTLGFVSDIYGEKTAHEICKYVEYIWNQDRHNDPFANAEISFYAAHEADENFIKYVVIAARYGNKWIWCRNERRGWELPGGKIEDGESPMDAARRELFEETGATKFDMKLVCAYKINNFGMLYFAEVYELGETPCAEIGSIALFDAVPKWTLSFPQYHPKMFDKIAGYASSASHNEVR